MAVAGVEGTALHVAGHVAAPIAQPLRIAELAAEIVWLRELRDVIEIGAEGGQKSIRIASGRVAVAEIEATRRDVAARIALAVA